MNTTGMNNNEFRVPLWLKCVAGLGVVWYGFGLVQFWLAYSMDTTAAVAQSAITAEHGAAIDSTPWMIWLSFAIASFAGLVGSLLLIKQAQATSLLFALSLFSALLYYGWVYLLSGTGGDRPSEEIIIAVVVGVVTLTYFLVSVRVARNRRAI